MANHAAKVAEARTAAHDGQARLDGRPEIAIARLPLGGKTVLLSLAILPLVLPSFVSAYALVLLFGRAGVVTHGRGWYPQRRERVRQR